MPITAVKTSCFAHNHLTPALYGVYKLISEISHKSGEYWVSSRGMERLFNGVSKTTLHRLTSDLLKSGWLQRVGQAKKRDHRGHFLPEKVKAVTHQEWVATHGPSACTGTDHQMHGRDRPSPTGGTLQSHGRDEVLDSKSERERSLPTSTLLKMEEEQNHDQNEICKTYSPPEINPPTEKKIPEHPPNNSARRPSKEAVEDLCYRMSRFASQKKNVPIDYVCFSGRSVDAVWALTKSYGLREIGDAWARYLAKYQDGNCNDLKYLVPQFCQDAATVLRSQREAAEEEAEQESRLEARRKAEELERAKHRQIAVLLDKRMEAAMREYDAHVEEYGRDDGFTSADPEAFEAGAAKRKYESLKGHKATFMEELHYSQAKYKLMKGMLADAETLATANDDLAMQDLPSKYRAQTETDT
ncbi:MAG: hypothetical protein ACM3WP_22725 [Acidobacteriota bacterium]